MSAPEQFVMGGAVAVLVLGLLLASSWGTGLFWLAIIAALAGLLVMFLPRVAPGTRLPGSRGSLLLLAGGVTAAAALLDFISELSWIPSHLLELETLEYLLWLIGALVMAWGAWLIFKVEGAKFTVGMPAAADRGPGSGPTDKPA